MRSSASRESACSVNAASANSIRSVSASTASRGGSPFSSTATGMTSMPSPKYSSASLRKLCLAV
jgi:hypothetical protein